LLIAYTVVDFLPSSFGQATGLFHDQKLGNTMREFIYIGSAPADESCAQVGAPDYQARAKVEIKEYLRMLREEFDLVDFRIKRESHDFGYYLEVVAYFDDEDEEQSKQAYDAECAFYEWDDEARQALAEFAESSK
jgi:hypothetical protein